jgi:hypothetical protein
MDHFQVIQVSLWKLDLFLVIIGSFITALGTKCDKFVMCPDEALNWTTRRFRQLFEIARHFPDVICLQVETEDEQLSLKDLS